MSTHLITGVTGQDGTLLAQLLLGLGHRVVGTCLEAPAPGSTPAHLILEHLDVTDTAGFSRILRKHRPAVVHNLAGQSSVGRSWRDPQRTRQVNQDAVIAMLEVVGEHPSVHFIQASSAEIFGPVTAPTATESTPLNPQSPYAEAKAVAHLAVRQAREQGLRASNLVLFGHTSTLQPTHFALPSICAGAAGLARGERASLAVQNPGVRRDWGAASDHMRAFALAADHPGGDFVIGTGVLTRLSEVIGWALAAAGVPDAPVEVTGSDRPDGSGDLGGFAADHSLATAQLGWRAEIALADEIARMVRERL